MDLGGDKVEGGTTQLKGAFWGHQECKKMTFEYVIVTNFNLMIYF